MTPLQWYHFLENDFVFDTEQRTDCEATNAVDWLEDGVQFGEYIEAYQLTTQYLKLVDKRQ